MTVEALESRKLAAHVVSVATLPTSTSGVVSYDVTFQLDQLDSGLKPGMSATAEVVVKQAEGVNVPDHGDLGRHGDGDARRQAGAPAVVTGLAGNSSTIVLSGLNAGEEVVLPVARTSAAEHPRQRSAAGGGGWAPPAAAWSGAPRWRRFRRGGGFRGG